MKTKLDRAREHLDEADRIARVVIDGYRNALIREPDASGSEITVRLGDVPALPENFTAIVGDFFHNVRSALDHLAWQLVLLNGLEPDERTAFPIREVRPKGGLRIVPGTSDSALAAVDSVQPYNWSQNPQLSPLAMLRRLNNIDKHRVPLVGVAVLSDGSWSSARDQTIDFLRSEIRALSSGDIVGGPS